MMSQPSEPLSLLVDRSLTIGADQGLVVYGGGNTSAKGELVDPFGRTRRVLWVKGSGADMAVSGERDYPALWLDELVAIRELGALDDDQMTDLVSSALVDPRSRRPSIETLLHAFLPFDHIDHVHADAICALTNHPQGRKATAEALGENFAYVDWLRPGFELSKLVGDLASYDGVVLAHHGLVVWSSDSADCLQRTRDAVSAADAYLDAETARNTSTDASHAGATHDLPAEDIDRLLLQLRGSLAAGSPRVLRVDTRLRAVADRPDVAKVLSGGVSSADHMLRIKPRSAVVLDLASPASAVQSYADEYRAYFARHADSLPADLAGSEGHDPLPRVLLVPGLGAVTTGRDERDAKVAADIAVRTHGVAARVLDAFGEVESLPEAEDFAFDYWPMELYKLALRPPAPRFAGTVQIVTGAASGIGRTIALTLAKAGASVVAADLDADGLTALADEAEATGGPRPATVVGDQSDEAVVLETTRTAIRTFGGLDGVVLSAGIGVSAPLEDLSLDRWQQALEVNLTSAFLLTREAIRAMRIQGRGGSLVYVASKNAFAPGAGFGAYSVTKAGMLQLMRIAALEGGEVGIRANAVNPDAVFDGSRLWEGGLREERAAAHGIAPDKLEDFYASRNLLHRKVTSHDVAAAVAYLLSTDSACTTGSVLPVDGGVAAAFPR